jgi:hypothetical protein
VKPSRARLSQFHLNRLLDLLFARPVGRFYSNRQDVLEHRGLQSSCRRVEEDFAFGRLFLDRSLRRLAVCEADRPRLPDDGERLAVDLANSFVEIVRLDRLSSAARE